MIGFAGLQGSHYDYCLAIKKIPFDVSYTILVIINS